MCCFCAFGTGTNPALLPAPAHGLQTAHALVGLEAHAVLIKVLSRRLVGARQHGAHHDAARPAGERLGDVSRALDAPVGKNRHAVFGGETQHVVDGAGLRPADRAHLLRGADGSDAHADAEAVRSRLY